MIASGLSLAIPSRSVGRFLTGTSARRPVLGITTRPVSLDSGRGLGFLVLEIAAQSPAERASLLPGDFLTGAAGRPFSSPDDLQGDLEDALSSSREGQLEIEFRRGTAHQVRRVIVQLAAERVKAA